LTVHVAQFVAIHGRAGNLMPRCSISSHESHRAALNLTEWRRPQEKIHGNRSFLDVCRRGDGHPSAIRPPGLVTGPDLRCEASRVAGHSDNAGNALEKH
jgi:hypothetical protein